MQLKEARGVHKCCCKADCAAGRCGCDDAAHAQRTNVRELSTQSYAFDGKASPAVAIECNATMSAAAALGNTLAPLVLGEMCTAARLVSLADGRFADCGV